MVQLFPNMKYYEEIQMEFALSLIPHRVKWAISTAGATGAGIVALIPQDKNYQALQSAINPDFKNVEQSITKETS